MPVYAYGLREAVPEGTTVKVNTTSRSANFGQMLSPFCLGPVNLYDELTSKNVENGWQYSKVYPGFVDVYNRPTKEYWDWARSGWNNSYAQRYPMGKGVKPLYSRWKGKSLSYIQARQKIYYPLYAQAVVGTEAYAQLKELYDKGETIALWDFDSYNFKALGMSYEEVLNNTSRKMGHSIVLCALLDGVDIGSLTIYPENLYSE